MTIINRAVSEIIIYKMNHLLMNHFSKYPSDKLMASQIATLDFMLKQVLDEKNNILIYHQMGTGKTILALAFAILASFKNIIYIVVPSLNVQANWDINLQKITSFFPKTERKSTNIRFITNKMFEGTQIFEDAIVIIDEAHAILEKTFFNNVNRYILLSGTPFYNTIEGLVPLISILTPNHPINPIPKVKVYYASVPEETLDEIENDDDLKISFYQLSDGPPSKFMGTDVLTTSIVDCPMVSPQFDEFTNFISKMKGDTHMLVDKRPMNISLCATGFEQLSHETNDMILNYGLHLSNGIIQGDEMLSLNVSSKLKHFMNMLLNEKGYMERHFLFFIISSYGTVILNSVFIANNIVEWGVPLPEKYFCKVHGEVHTPTKNCVPLRYVILTYHSKVQVMTVINAYNNGEIDIICGSKIISESFTLKNTNNVWFLTIPDTPSMTDQVVARAVRKFALDKEMVIKIHLLVATLPNDILPSSFAQAKKLLDDTEHIISIDLRKVLYNELKKKNFERINNIFIAKGKMDYGPKIHPMLYPIITFYEALRFFKNKFVYNDTFLVSKKDIEELCSVEPIIWKNKYKVLFKNKNWTCTLIEFILPPFVIKYSI